VYAEDHQGDWRLPNWRKSVVPILSLPPPGIKLAGWRDPYIVGECNQWAWLIPIWLGLSCQTYQVHVHLGMLLDGSLHDVMSDVTGATFCSS
jgi:hypothetical protein